jgi:hypothetical protein
MGVNIVIEVRSSKTVALCADFEVAEVEVDMS